MARYPRVCSWVSFKELADGQYCVEDSVNGIEYIFDKEFAEFVQRLDGKTDPFAVLISSRRHAQNLLTAAHSIQVVRLGRMWKTSGSFMLTLYESKKAMNRLFAKILHAMFSAIWLPLLLLGIHTFISNIDILDFEGSTLLGMISGVVTGSLFHEMGHALTAVALGGKFLEAGICLHHWLPCGYALVDDSPIQSPIKRSLVDLAGVQANFALAGLSLIGCVLLPHLSAFLFAASVTNLALALTNLVLAGPLDGKSTIRALLDCRGRKRTPKSNKRIGKLLNVGMQGVFMLYRAFIPLSYALFILESLEEFLS